ncbi:hypothetical protein [Luteipulveratus mongoliensis]|uniref:hypothetical protein n=1 Tax=Luteipulveratus mongoliensis TaxID=571913 RepID=UPI00069768F4|nr:hypothetical protein [Luteipulveratus mongoliensis]
MSTYTATAERDGRFWLIRVEDVGVTQARHLREADAMARDLVAVTLDFDPEDVTVDMTIVLPTEVQKDIDEAARLRVESERANHDAADRARSAARRLSAMDMPIRDVGAALGVSHQRAQQLVSADKAAARKTVARKTAVSRPQRGEKV